MMFLVPTFFSVVEDEDDNDDDEIQFSSLLSHCSRRCRKCKVKFVRPRLRNGTNWPVSFRSDIEIDSARLYDAAPLEIAKCAIILLLLLIPSSRSLCQWNGSQQCSSTVPQNFILQQNAIYKNCVAATSKVYRKLLHCFGKH